MLTFSCYHRNDTAHMNTYRLHGDMTAGSEPVGGSPVLFSMQMPSIHIFLGRRFV